MDTLSDILNLVRFKSCVYFLKDFTAPWGMEMPDGPHAQFHMVVRGHCWLRLGDALTALDSGDIVVLPHGAAHHILDAPQTAPVAGRRVLEAHRAGRPIFADGAARTRLLCGHFELDHSVRHPLIGELPRLIHVKGLSAERPDWFEAVGHLLVRESGADSPGGACIVERLAEVLFIQVLRAHIEQRRPAHGFLAAVTDRQINHALQTIHGQNSTALTLADIAREAGMSRSNLALRFKALVGETPIDYLTRWRMLKAQEMLRASTDPLLDIAERVGYASEAAFSRAFKRHFAQTPGAFRRFAATRP